MSYLFDLYINLQEQWDSADKVANSNSYIFNPQSWAPGIWAGTEGAKIKVEGIEYTIESVDLVNRVINLKNS